MFGGLRAEFDPVLARELLLLIGRSYTQYLEHQYGRPGDWPPRHRRLYERYRATGPEALPGGFQLEEIITWSPARTGFGLTRDQAHAIGFLARSGPLRYLVFRGTASEREWWQDLQLTQKQSPVATGRFPPGRVHQGFGRIFGTLDPSPVELYERISRKRGPLLIAGHSLGGALAVLSALELRALRPVVYTFAAPRIGDPVFAETYERLVPRTFRVCNFWDPVPKMPDRTVDLLVRKFHYRHVGREVPLYSLSQAGGESIPHLMRQGMDLTRYVLQGGKIDPLFTHQVKAYEHGLDKL